MPEGAGRGERAEPADVVGQAARMRPEPAMHRHAHVVVDALAGEVARDELHHARRDDARAVEAAALKQHLIERGHGARRAEAAAAGHPGAAELGAVLLCKAHLAAPILRWRMHLRGTLALGV